MINGLSKWTTDSGKAIDYFLGDDYYDEEDKEWKEREPKPVILEGDPQAMKFICDKLEFKNKYTTGVLSFSPEETNMIAANPGLKDQILQDFKDFAFAGVPDGARQFLAIEHSHTKNGRLEIHYMMPRVHLESGKYRNPFPPNYNGKRGKGHNDAFIKENDAYIDHACAKFGLTNPRDPSIARDLKINAFDKESANKKDVHKLVCELVDSGHITCREDIESLFKELGGKITRNGDDYISVKFSDDQKAMRFKGDIYDKSEFGAKAISESAVHGATRIAEGSIEQKYEDVLAYRTQETLRRHSSQRSRDKESTEPELDIEGSELNAESEFSELLAAHEAFENSTNDLVDVKSSAADFVSSHRSQVANYREKLASITTGVEVGDIATIQTDDPVSRFFLNQFKQQAQKEAQRALAAGRQIWGTSFAAPAADDLAGERAVVIFKAAFGMLTGIDIDRPEAVFDCKALGVATAKASDLKAEHAVEIEHNRKAAVDAAVAAAKEKAADIKAKDERARKEREERRVPSWKRNRHDLDDDSGPRPGGR
ncbi:hypothetical protein [Pseudomonas frederiksbergensis]|uniref:hypothetical protein n=1 Tax=Pseudomonas frederiksbergensis TaxID=104087 RepID=UPI003D239B4E